MSEMKQQLSICMDSELDLDANQHLLAATSNTQELKQCWREYHLIGDVLRGDSEMHIDIRHKVMEQLAGEPIAFAPRRRVNTLFANHYMTSMAASVAAVGFVAWMVWQSQAGPTPTPINVAQNTVSQIAPQPVSQPLPQAQNVMTAESFDHYLLAHHEYASGNTMQRDVQLTSYPQPGH